MAEYALHRSIAQRRDEAHCVSHQVEHTEGGDIAVEVTVPSGGAPVSALIGRDDVITRRRERQHDFAPAVRKFGKAMEQKDKWSVVRFMAGFQYVHSQAVDAVYKSGPDSRGQDALGQGGCRDHRRLAIGNGKVSDKLECFHSHDAALLVIAASGRTADLRDRGLQGQTTASARHPAGTQRLDGILIPELDAQKSVDHGTIVRQAKG